MSCTFAKPHLQQLKVGMSAPMGRGLRQILPCILVIDLHSCVFQRGWDRSKPVHSGWKETHWRNCSFPQVWFSKPPRPSLGHLKAPLGRAVLGVGVWRAVCSCLFSSSVRAHCFPASRNSPKVLVQWHTPFLVFQLRVLQIQKTFCCPSSATWETVDDLTPCLNLFES